MCEPCSMSRIIFASVLASTFFATTMMGMSAMWATILTPGSEWKKRWFWEEWFIPYWSYIWTVSIIVCILFNLFLYNCKI